MFSQLNFQRESRKRKRESIAKINAAVNKKIDEYMKEHREEIENGFREDGQDDSEIQESMEVLRRNLQISSIKRIKEIRKEIAEEKRRQIDLDNQTNQIEPSVPSMNK